MVLDIKLPDPNPYKIKVTNIVIEINFGGKIPLDRIANMLPSAEYEPESFPGLVYRMTDPKATALVFTSGRAILSGINDIEKAKKAVKRMLEDFGSIGIKFEKEPEIKIVNLVASADLGVHLDLNTLVYELENCEYEPEQFPGLVYRMDDPPVVVLIFNTGRVNITGSRDISVVARAAENLRKKVEEIGAVLKKKED
ncbi:MAG: TATA-box-binding protein [Candidatus Nanohaloarchaeota archaeon]|nr:TATA-box-binding protein [Candidatus Nanohaloarchaeota archaeon]